MAKLPARHKVTVLLFRRVGLDEVLIVETRARGMLRWSLPSEELAAGESARDGALRVAARLAPGAPIADLDLGEGATYRVSAGPSAGEWTERFHAVEAAPGRRPTEGRWAAHYDAKAAAGADVALVREAFTRLRERARLKP